MALPSYVVPTSQQEADEWKFQSVQEFRAHLPSLCDQFTQCELATTSHTVDFLPGWWGITSNQMFSHQALLVSTHEEAEENLPNELLAYLVRVLVPESEDELGIDVPWESMGIGHRLKVKNSSGPIGPKYPHPLGIIHRARHMPQRPHLVATQCNGSGLCLYNIQPTLDSLALDVSDEDGQQECQQLAELQYGPIAYLGSTPAGAAGAAGHQPIPQGQGLCWSPSVPGQLLSTCADSTVAIIQIEPISQATPPVYQPDTAEPSVTGTVQLFSAAEQLQGVNDAAWAPPDSPLSGQHVFAAAGQRGQVVFWDTRAGPAHVGHCRAHKTAVNSLSFRSQGSTLVTGGQDGHLCVLDVRRLSNNGAALNCSILAQLKGPGGSKPLPQQPVLQVACSPHAGSSLLASVDAGARVMLWDLAATQRNPYTRYTQLRTIHAGHAGAIGDVSWSRCRGPPLLASVSQAFSREGYMETDEHEIPPVMQVWTPCKEFL